MPEVRRWTVWFRLTAFGLVGPLDLPARNSIIGPHEAEMLSGGQRPPWAREERS